VNKTPQCQAQPGQFTLNPQGDNRVVAPEDEEVDLPFAVELGSAIFHNGGFAVAALRASKVGNEAVVALLPPGLSGGQVLELGPVHGDVSPPRLSSNAGELILVAPDADASGQSLRLGSISGSQGARIRWGASVHDGDDESQAFEVAVSGKQGILVWDDWQKSENHGVVKLARFSSSDVGVLSPPEGVSKSGADAEAPRVVAAQHGFWLAFIVNEDSAGSVKDHSKRTARGQAGSAAAEDDIESERTLRASLRAIELVRLDKSGAIQGEAQRITPPGARVTQFDLASDHQGAAYLAWRAGASSLASEGGEVGVLVVSPDGTQNRLPLGEIESGSGVPQLFFDDATPSSGVLAVAKPGDDTELLSLSVGQPSQPLTLIGSAASAMPVAFAGKQLLLVRALGRGLQLTSALCR